MTPLAFRNANWDALQSGLNALQRSTWQAWSAHGPGTTREVAARCGMDLLTFRPRTTELMQTGALCLDETQPSKREGRYRVRTRDEYEAWRESWMKAHATDGQLQMTLPA